MTLPPRIRLSLTPRETLHLINLLYEHGTARDVDLIRELETAVDDAATEADTEPLEE